MKNLEMASQQVTTENKVGSAVQSAYAVQFGEVLVYNEMADQTAVRMNLLEQINSQMAQIDELNQRRQYVLKEIIQQINS
jgi:hypothetical protein